MAIANLTLAISLQGAAQVQQGLNSLVTSADTASKALAFMRSALVAIASAEIAKRFLELADTFTQMENRLRVLTGNVADFTAVTRGLIAVSQQTGTALAENALLFTRLARAVGGTGATYSQVLAVTREVAEVVLISGANAIQAKQGFLQLAEGLGSGALRGRQLRSVVQDFPALADVIAKGFKGAGNAASLLGFALANPNVLKSDLVFKALVKGADDIQKQFATTTFTIGQGFQKINNALVVFLGNVVNTTVIGKVLTGILGDIADNIGLIVASLAALAGLVAINVLVSQFVLLGARVASLIGLFSFLLTPFKLFNTLILFVGTVGVGAFSLLSSAVGALINPLGTVVDLFVALRLAVITNPIFLIGAVITIGALVAAFFLLGGSIDKVEENLGNLGGAFGRWAITSLIYIETVIDRIRDIPKILANVAAQTANASGNFLVSATNSLVHGLHDLTGNGPGTAAHELHTVAPGQIPLPFPEADQSFHDTFAQNLRLAGGGADRDRLGTGTPSFGGTQTGTFLQGVKDFGKTDFNLNEIMDQLNHKITQIGETSEESSAKVKGLEKALAVLASISPEIAFDKKMLDTADAIAKQGAELAKFGFTAQEVFDRIGRAAAGFGNIVKESTEQAKIARKVFDLDAEGGNPITAAQLQARTLAIGGAGSAEGLDHLSQQIEFLSGELKIGQISATAFAAGVREITGTQTDADKFAATFDKIQLSAAAGALTVAQLNVQLRAAFGATTPIDTYNAALAKTSQLLNVNLITRAAAIQQDSDARLTFLDTQTDFQSGVDRTFLKMQKDSADVATQISTVMTDAFSSATDALVTFVNTGKIDLTSFISSIESDLLKLATNQIFNSLFGDKGASNTNNLISTGANKLLGLVGLGSPDAGAGIGGTGPLAGLGGQTALVEAGTSLTASGLQLDAAGTALSLAATALTSAATALGASSTGSGISGSLGSSSGGGIGDFFGSLFGISGAAGIGTTGPAAGLGGQAFLAGFADGGSFDVASGAMHSLPNGIDNKIVAFRANDTEAVHVTKKGVGVGATEAHLHVHGVTDADSIKRSWPQIAASLGDAIVKSQRRLR